MLNGIYSVTFRGMADWGMGMLLLREGILTGADAGGVLYDGDYTERGNEVALNVVMTIPPGVALVQGTPPQSTPYSIRSEMVIPRRAFDNSETVRLDLPPGPVNAIFKLLRKL
jgi:hypothetical protein